MSLFGGKNGDSGKGARMMMVFYNSITWEKIIHIYEIAERTYKIEEEVIWD